MYFIDTQHCQDAKTNMALERYLVENRLIEEPILLLCIHDPAILIGRNQNTVDEINQQYVDKHHISVTRRMSGGGAVYHDHGCLSFCIIKDDDHTFRDFDAFTQPVIKALHKMGAKNAALHGRNDLVIGGKKFSGNGMYVSNGRMTAHGTMLFDSDLAILDTVLSPAKEKLASHGCHRAFDRVTNIKPHLSAEWQHLTVEAFRDQLLLHIFDIEKSSHIPEYHLTAQGWEEVAAIREEFFDDWEWNYGDTIVRSERKRFKYPDALLDIRFNLNDNLIRDVKIYGDFFGLGNIADLEEALTGQVYDVNAIQSAVNHIELQRYIGNIQANELATLMCSSSPHDQIDSD